MVRMTNYQYINHEQIYREYAGLSTDTKPTEGIITGSLFMEVDTGNIYAWDEEGEEWNKLVALGGD